MLQLCAVSHNWLKVLSRTRASWIPSEPARSMVLLTYLLLFPLFLFLLLRRSAFFLVQGKYNSIMMHYGLRELGVVYDVFCHSWHNKKHKSSSVIRTGKWPLSAVSTYHLIQLMNALNLKSYEITVVLTVQL